MPREQYFVKLKDTPVPYRLLHYQGKEYRLISDQNVVWGWMNSKNVTIKHRIRGFTTGKKPIPVTFFVMRKGQLTTTDKLSTKTEVGFEVNDLDKNLLFFTKKTDKQNLAVPVFDLDVYSLDKTQSSAYFVKEFLQEQRKEKLKEEQQDGYLVTFTLKSFADEDPEYIKRKIKRTAEELDLEVPDEVKNTPKGLDALKEYEALDEEFHMLQRMMEMLQQRKELLRVSAGI
jgi:hypothetical protein